MLQTIQFELEGTRQWKFSANAIISFYKVLGKNAFNRLKIFETTPEELNHQEEPELLDAIRQRRTMEEMPEYMEVFRGLLWCGLVGTDLKLEQVGEMIHPALMTELLPKLLNAASESMSANPTPAQSGDSGSSNGHLAASISA